MLLYSGIGRRSCNPSSDQEVPKLAASSEFHYQSFQSAFEELNISRLINRSSSKSSGYCKLGAGTQTFGSYNPEMKLKGSKKRDHQTKPHVIARKADSLRIVAFSDCRVQDTSAIVSWVASQPQKPDLIVYAGDDVRRFTPDPETNHFEMLASLSRYGLVAVTGNDDLPGNRALIRGRRVYEVHSRPIAIGRFLIVGVEGAPAPGIGFTLHPETEISEHLHRSIPKNTDHNIIMVSHTPPRGCLDEARRWTVGQIGSTAVREALESDTRISLVVSGHVHLCGGRQAELGSATVVNAASSDNDPGQPTKIATLTLRSDGRVEDIQWTEIVSSLNLASEINGIGRAHEAKLAQAGITTIEQLAEASPLTVGNAIGWSPKRSKIFTVRAQARLDGRPSLVEMPEFPKRPHLYLDIETDLQQSYTWLVGVASEEGDEVRQFFASHPDKEDDILEELSAFLVRVADHSLVHFSGTQFDRRILVQRMEHYNLTPPPALLQSTDFLHTLRRCLALPTRSLKLKEAAEYLGYRFAHSDLDGFMVAYEYQKALKSGHPVQEKLLSYNRDDVLALRSLLREVEKLAHNPLLGRPAIPKHR